MGGSKELFAQLRRPFAILSCGSEFFLLNINLSQTVTGIRNFEIISVLRFEQFKEKFFGSNPI